MNDVYMDIETFVSPCLYENCYLCSFADFSFVVDPSIPYETLKKKSSKPIKYVLITHAHYDHINELKTYMNRGITFYIGKEDYNKLLDAHLNLSLYIIGKSWQVDLKNEKVILVTEKSYKLEEEELEVYETKGHTDGSVSYCIGDALFTGDFIFKNGVGRMDFPTGSTSDMQKSIEKIKKVFKNKFIDVFPGHGEDTNIQYIIKYIK